MSAVIIDILPARQLVEELRLIHREDARADGVQALVNEVRAGGTGWNTVNDVINFRKRLESRPGAAK